MPYCIHRVLPARLVFRGARSDSRQLLRLGLEGRGLAATDGLTQAFTVRLAPRHFAPSLALLLPPTPTPDADGYLSYEELEAIDPEIL
jgi:hypothetical protein